MKSPRLPKTSRPNILIGTIAAFVAITAIPAAHAGPLAFGTPGTVTADTDVLTTGNFVYGFTQSNVAATLNGVSFAAATSFTTLGGGSITISGLTGVATSAFDDGTNAAPFTGLSTDYRNLLMGAAYGSTATATVSLNTLTPGRTYAAQVWANDSRAGATTTRTQIAGGLNAVTVDYNNTNALNGVGQHVTGVFVASSATQSFTLQGNASSQLNAVQLRDVTNIGAWTGLAGGILDSSTSANFATNLFSAPLSSATYTAARAPLGALTFGDVYYDNGAIVPVAQTAIGVAAGGVSGGSLIFSHSAALEYSITSSDAIGITGATNLSVSGGGNVTLSGAHTFTGAVNADRGTLKVGSANVFTGTGNVNMTGIGVLDLNGFNAKFTGNGTGSGGIIADNSAGTGTTTLSLLQTTNAGGFSGAAINDGATRVLAVEATNANGGIRFTNPNSTFSGGIKLLNNAAAGTRLTIDSAITTTFAGSAIASSNFGRGAITIGSAPTDRAGIFVALTGQTIANDIVMNTALGTDRPGFRSDAAATTLSGTLIANLAPFTLSTNGTAAINLTGRITGPLGLELDNQFGTSITATLNNATANPNDYAGITNIEGVKGNLVLGAANQIPNGIGKGNVSNNGNLRLNGFDETINGLDGGATGTIDGISGAPTLVLGDGDANGVFGGIIRNTAGNLALTKVGTGRQVLGGANTYTGPTTVSAGKLVVTGSLVAGTTVSVASGATLGGSGTIAGNVAVANGARIESGDGATPGTLTVGAITFGTAAGDLAALTLRPYASPAVSVTGTDTLVTNGGAGSATIFVFGNALSVGNTYTLVDYVGAALSPASFGAFMVSPQSRVKGTLIDNGANTSVDFSVTSIDTIRWSGAAGSEWSTAAIGAPKNWVLTSGATQTDFLQGDTASFTDAATSFTVNVSNGNVSPESVNFNHSSNDYTLGGNFGISGGSGLTKVGTRTLTITNTNSFAGAVEVKEGIVSVASVANGGANSSLGSGTNVVLGDAATTGTLRFTGVTGTTNRAIALNGNGGVLDVAAGSALTVSGAIGGGVLTKLGTGTLTLSGANTFTGGFLISGGTVVAGGTAALGGTANAIAVESGASLNINSQRLDGYTGNILIAGAGSDPSLGVLGNGGAPDQLNGIRGITLFGNASIGGNGGRWDIGRIDFNTNPTLTVDHINGGGFVLTKVGTGYLGLLTGATDLAGFVVDGGTVAPHENTSFGAGPVTVNNGSIVKPWGGTNFANAFTINSGTLQNDGFTDTYSGPMTVNGLLTLNPSVTGSIVINGGISGAGAVTKTGPFSAVMAGFNNYTGATTVNAGTLLVNGTITGSTTTVNTGGTLGGTGGLDTVNVVGGSISPGAGAGTLMTVDLSLDANSFLKFELVDPTVVGGGLNDQLVVSGDLTLDGTLQVTELAGFIDGTYRLIDYFGALTNNGLALESAFTLAHPGSYIDTVTQGQVNLVVVPEPAAVLSLFGGMAVLAGLRRRRG